MATVDARDPVIRVSVPARADMLHLLRSVTASVGARMSMPLDLVEDLRIAVDEAATLLLDRSERHASFELELVSAERSLRVLVRLSPAAWDGSDEALRSSWPWRVIDGVTEDATIERTEDGVAIGFTRTIPGMHP
jgi:serine/threonine-protein kinase RsbW